MLNNRSIHSYHYVMSNPSFLTSVYTCLHKDKCVNLVLLRISINSFAFVINKAIVNNHGLTLKCIREEENFFRSGVALIFLFKRHELVLNRQNGVFLLFCIVNIIKRNLYTCFFYKNIKIFWGLQMFLTFFDFKPKNILKMFLCINMDI